MNNALGLLGIAKKAGKLAIGEEASSMAVRDHHAKAVFTAHDASARAVGFAENARTIHIHLEETREELGNLFGRASCAIFAVCDVGIAAAVAEKLGEPFKEQSIVLSEMAERAKHRKLKKISRKGKIK
ncbi:MAG: hypothetical protein RR829_05420 [Oscillospiraceae bacterium]